MSGYERKTFLLIYASQTGQAEAIAEEVKDTAEKKGFEPNLFCLSKIDKEFSLEKEKCAVIIVSTTGDGEPPETALKFWRRIKKRTLASTYLSHLRYCLLALGDSNYTTFCNFGRELDQRLQQLGAVRFMKTVCADDAVGLEVTVEPWIDSLWSVLEKECVCESLTDKENCISQSVLSSTKMTDLLNSVEMDFKLRSNDSTKLPASISNGTTDDKTPIDVKSNSTYTETVNKVLDSNTELLKELTVDMKEEENELLSGLITSSISNDVILNKANIPSHFLTITFDYNSSVSDEDLLSVQKNFRVPSNGEELHWIPIKRTTQLTAEDAIKTVLEIQLDISKTNLQFNPGDNVYIMCENTENDVNYLIERLNLNNVADVSIKLEIDEQKNKIATKHFKQLSSLLTLRQYLKKYFDIRSIPKKVLLRVLAESTTNPSEKRRLVELCSRQGNDDYIKYVRNLNTSVLDILAAFPTCQPSIEDLLEQLPILQPRPYSVACSPLVDISSITLAFTLVELPENIFSSRKYGLCTGWLNRITKKFQQNLNDFKISDTSSLTILNNVQIPIYVKRSVNFHLPDDESVPILMICAGTGLAPFIGFLEHREIQKRNGKISTFGEMWLFYGCRNKEKDFLYRDKIEEFKRSGVLSKFFVTFSRDTLPETENKMHYVQDAILHNKADVVNMIVQKKATVYVCGDVQNMAKDVHSTLKNILIEDLWLSTETSEDYIIEMQRSKKYIQDIWL